MFGTIALCSGAARARVTPRGAQLIGWRVGEAELLWAGDPKFWPEQAPILFPVVGWTRDGIRVNGRNYPLGLHGFARDADFSVIVQEENRLRLALRADAASLALYPFDFLLCVEYLIENNYLKIIIEVFNQDDKPMFYACGVHPGFVWPLPGGRGAHKIRFDADERDDVPIIAPGGLFSTRRRQIGLQGRDLPLRSSDFEEALCFLDARSAGLEFCAENGPSLRMAVENFPHLALWSRPGAPFLCLEAWTGYGDPEDFIGELSEKPSMRRLEPGAGARSAASFCWRPHKDFGPDFR